MNGFKAFLVYLWSFICTIIGPLKPSLEALAFGAVQAGINAVILFCMSGGSEITALAVVNIFGTAAIKYIFLKANISYSKSNLSFNLPLDPGQIKDGSSGAAGPAASSGGK